MASRQTRAAAADDATHGDVAGTGRAKQLRDAGSSTAAIGTLVELAGSIRAALNIDRAMEELVRATTVVGADHVSVVDEVFRSAAMFEPPLRQRLQALDALPASFKQWWNTQDVWSRNPDTVACRSHHLPFASLLLAGEAARLPPWAGTMRERIEDAGIFSSVVVPVHLAGCACYFAWTSADAWAGERIAASMWAPLMTIGYAFAETVRRLHSHHGVPAPRELTVRQRESVYWLAQGKTVADIGIILGISPYTVEEYLKIAAIRLDAQSRAQLIVRACQIGIV